MNGDGKEQRLLRALVTNVQRADLNPVEEAQAYQQLREMGLSVEKIAIKVGKNRVTIESRLKLLELQPPVQDLVNSGALPRDARLTAALLDIPAKEQVKIAEGLAKRGVTVAAAVKACERVAAALIPDAALKPDAEPVVLRLAKKKAKVDDVPTPEWNMLFQTGRVPPWQVVADAAMETCDACGFRSIASEETCRQCPAVDFLLWMLRSHDANRH